MQRVSEGLWEVNEVKFQDLRAKKQKKVFAGPSGQKPTNEIPTIIKLMTNNKKIFLINN